ncbi:MAG: glycosyl hydrolase family 28 protein, partial [Bacteroidales bacterium]|nr:glycosyl hydrolase family 28 protein [Bacteroidales bacterium]
MRYLFYVVIICWSSSLRAENFNLTALGAISDGKHLCTELIQTAIDRCSASGGGTVTVPPGTFLTGTVFMKSHVNLFLENGAVLLGSTDVRDYKPRYLITASGAENISITGGGTINGQGYLMWDRTGRTTFAPGPATFVHRRPSTGNLIQLENCSQVIIQDVTLRGSESWTLHLLACNDVQVTGIRIRNHLHGPNTDGIDIQASRNVRITGCDIFTNDDAIVIKNRHPKYYGRIVENIVVTNCILTTVCNGFKIGTESMSDFRNIVFSNSVIKTARKEDELAEVVVSFIDPDNYRDELAPISGIALESVDGANLQGVAISNIVMEGVRAPIFIRLANRGGGEQKVAVPVPGSLKDIIISNVVAYGASIPSSVTAIPGSYVENVKLQGITIRTRGGGTREMANVVPDEKIKSYPEAKMWGDLPASGFYIRHVKGLQIADVSIDVEENDRRPLVKFDDVVGLYVHNLQTNETCRGSSVLDFVNVKDVR